MDGSKNLQSEENARDSIGWYVKERDDGCRCLTYGGRRADLLWRPSPCTARRDSVPAAEPLRLSAKGLGDALPDACPRCL
jgi:hypothetical protein